MTDVPGSLSNLELESITKFAIWGSRDNRDSYCDFFCYLLLQLFYDFLIIINIKAGFYCVLIVMMMMMCGHVPKRIRTPNSFHSFLIFLRS